MAGCGGGIIKQKSICAIILALGIVLFALPVNGASDNQNIPQETPKISNNQKYVEVNAAYKSTKKRTYKSTSSYKTVRSAKLKSYKKTYYKRYTRAYKSYKKVSYKYAYKWVKVRGKWKKVRYTVYASSKPASSPSVAAASTTTSSKVTQGNPEITADYVSADARCSCSLQTDYNVHRHTWKNYCPYCSKKGTLTYTNQQGCPEGMFYCDMVKSGCDADFCIVHGKAHVNTNPKYLTPA